MFDIFEDVAEQKAPERLSAPVYESGFVPSASFSHPPSMKASTFDEKAPSYKTVLPVLFGACAGIALQSSLPGAFPPLLIASLFSLYRR